MHQMVRRDVATSRSGGMLLYAASKNGPYQHALGETLRCLQHYEEKGYVRLRTTDASKASYPRPAMAPLTELVHSSRR